MPAITREELKKKVDRNDKFVLIEVLDEKSYRASHLPRAKNVPIHAKNFADLVAKVAPDKSVPVVVYCANLKCEASGEASDALQELGYQDVREYAEGKEDWRNAGYPMIHQEVTMLVRDIMNKKVDVIHFDKTVEEAAKMMAKANYGALPVERADKMVGMLTDRDIAVRVIAEGKDPKAVRVQDCMSKGIDYCYDDESVDVLADKMAANGHRRIPVVNREKRLVGIVSLRELALSAGDKELTHSTLERIYSAA